MIRKTIAALLVALALPAVAQSVPAANYSDIWWNPNESGWGVTFTQHPTSNQVFAVWYTYDPRAADSASPGNFKPLWLVMPGGQWATPTHLTGDVYVTVASTGTGSFSYAIAAPSGLASADPAFGIPSFSGTKQIQRQPF